VPQQQQGFASAGLEPAHQEIDHAWTGLVRPESIELFAKHIGFEQAPIHREQRPDDVTC